MKSSRLFFLILACYLSFAAIGQSQDTHVRSEYMPKIKMTKVESDMMFVINTVEQFMQVGLIARYPNQQLVTPPKNVTVTIFSNSPKLLYEGTNDQNLIAITDGESWKAGELKYWSGKGSKTDKGQEMFASEKRPGLGLQNPLPPNANVGQGRAIDQLYLEWLIIELKPEQFARLAQAHKVEFQIGRTKFQFTDDQMNTIRAFASSITPH
jgi:hypothetical protein